MIHNLSSVCRLACTVVCGFGLAHVRGVGSILLCVVFFFACSPGSDGTDESDGSSRGFVQDDSTFGACVTFVAARCERVASCSGDDRKNECELEALAACPDEVFAVGSNFTKQDALACADEWRAFDCDALRNFEIPECAGVPGDLPDGEPCLSSSQCQNGCLKEPATTCGICAPWADGEAACRNGETVCPGLSTCQGETCVHQIGDEGCGGQCADSQVCAEEECLAPSESGDSCVQGQVGPDFFYYCTAADLICVAGKCQALESLPGAGEECLIEFNGGARQTLCRPGLACSDDELCLEPQLGEPCVGPTEQCGSEQVCSEGVCLERLRYRQQGCEDRSTQCDAGTTCQENVCLGHSSSNEGVSSCEG